MKRIRLLVIDPQNDFMDVDGAALPVPGASADMARLTGCMSPVAGFEDAGTAFLQQLQAHDVATATAQQLARTVP